MSGFHEIMHESRTFPRFIPRIGKQVKVYVGEPVPIDHWDEVRAKYRLIKRQCDMVGGEEGERMLKEGHDAVALRIQVAKMVRDQVAGLRLKNGYPAEDEGADLAQTYKVPARQQEGAQPGGVWEREQ